MQSVFVRTGTSPQPLNIGLLLCLAAVLFFCPVVSFASAGENSARQRRPTETGARQGAAPAQGAAQPSPFLEITPTTAVVAVGRPRRLSLWNDAGEQVTDATWSLSNPELGEIVSAESEKAVQPETREYPRHGTVVLLGKSAGRVTVTARSKNAAAHATIEIVPGPYLPGGANRWVVAARPGYSTIRFQYAQPAENAPAIYCIENGGEKGLLVRALDLDGTQIWIYRWAEPIGAAALQDSPTPALSTNLKPGAQAFIRTVPDTQGGVILHFEDASSHSLLADLDPLSGKEVWRYVSPGWLYRTSTTHYDGTLYIVEMQKSPKPETALLGLDTLTGVVKSRVPFPVSQRGEKNFACKPGNDHIVEYPSTAGAPLTSGNASVLVEVEVSSSIRDSQPCDRGGILSISNSLRLLEVKRDGSHQWRTIKEFTYDGLPNSEKAKSVPRAIPSEVIPDGRGGVQAAWTYQVGSPVPRSEARITRISASEMKEFSLPFAGWGGTPWDPADRNMVLGEQSGEQTMGMASVGNLVVGYDVVTGAVKWTWRAEQGRVQIIMALAGNGLLVMNRGEVVELDAKGQLTAKSQEVLSKRYRVPVAVEDGDNDQIDADGMTAFRFDYGQFLAIQTPRPPARPSALVAIALGGQLY
jgi:hypothetical protein